MFLLPGLLFWALCTLMSCRAVLRETQDLFSGCRIWYCFSELVFYRFALEGLGEERVLCFRDLDVVKDSMNQKNKCVLRCAMMHWILSSLLLERNCQWITNTNCDGDFTTELTQLYIVRKVISLIVSFLIMQNKRSLGEKTTADKYPPTYS